MSNTQKTIFMVGVFDVPGSTNIYMANAFEALGHTVIRYNYRTVLKSKNYNSNVMSDDLLMRVLSTPDIDLVIFCKVDSVLIEYMREISNTLPTWYWFMDPPETGKNIKANLRAKACTYASATVTDVAKDFVMYNRNSFRILEGVDLSLFRPLDLKKDTDILFVGTFDTYRASFLSAIEDKYNLKIYGHSWPSSFKSNGLIAGESLVEEINKAKLVINLSRSRGYSDRVTQTLACKSLVISTPSEDLEKDYSGLVPTFSCKEELTYLVEDLINKDNSSLIETLFSIATKASWEDICKFIIEVAFYDEL